MPKTTQEPISEAEAARLFADLARAPALILAVSGGPDSTALLWLAARWRNGLKKTPKLISVTVDHGLRKESAREARAVAKLSRTLKVEHRTLRWTGRKPKTGIQEAAREARYRLLGAASKKAGATHIVTAHTQDDQAETVLFRLMRGSGVAGLRGMTREAQLPSFRGADISASTRVCDALWRRARNPYPRAGVMDSGPGPSGRPGMTAALVVRPLLDVPKSRLVATLAAAKIPFVDDPSNRDPRFTRPRLRELMPKLATEGMDAGRLASLAARIARADAAIEHAVGDAARQVTSKSGERIVFASAYANQPAEISLRLLGRAIAQTGHEGPVELGKLEALHEALADAMSRGAPFRRTLAGAMITLSGAKLTVEPAPPRRTDVKAGKSARKGTFTKPR